MIFDFSDNTISETGVYGFVNNVFLASAGTTYYKSLVGGLTFSGALVKKISLTNLSGALTFVGTLSAYKVIVGLTGFGLFVCNFLRRRR
jgi:hypothetical protein